MTKWMKHTERHYLRVYRTVPLDTATPAGRMVFTVLGAVAELERSLIVERVKAGLRLRKPRANGSAVRSAS